MANEHERIGAALDLLTAGLAPYVERELKAIYPDRWVEAAASSFRNERLQGDLKAGIIQWDAHSLLTVMWDQWNAVFRAKLGISERSLVGELREMRNRWAHQADFDADDSYRMLDSAQRLLKAINAIEQMQLIAAEKQEVLQGLFGRRVNETLHRDRHDKRLWLDTIIYSLCAIVIIFTICSYIGPRHTMVSTIISAFVAFGFAILVWQRWQTDLPVYGVHECHKCRRIVYSEFCPYCDPQLSPPAEPRRTTPTPGPQLVSR